MITIASSLPHVRFIVVISDIRHGDNTPRGLHKKARTALAMRAPVSILCLPWIFCGTNYYMEARINGMFSCALAASLATANPFAKLAVCAKYILLFAKPAVAGRAFLREIMAGPALFL